MPGIQASSEVIKFMASFSSLREHCDDDPLCLADLVSSDAGVKSVCYEVWWAAHILRMNERRRRELFASPVDPKFLETWRDFEARYESTLSNIWLSDLFLDVGSATAPIGSEAERQWEFADGEATCQAQAIEDAIDFARDQVADDWREFPDGFREGIEDGAAGWERLKQDAGFDLRGVLRRRSLVPFVLVPRHVASKQGSSDVISLLRNLQQAHDAFVFGTPFAALALMRSILEAVLRDHYGADGVDLSARINRAKPQLPRAANASALHRLRRIGNAVLHLNPLKGEELPRYSAEEFEREIVALLFVLRALIEGAPQRAARAGR